MLPAPITLDRGRRQLQKYGRRQLPPSLSFLLVRSRLTNLSVAVLLGFALLSLSLNFRYYLASPVLPIATIKNPWPPRHQPWNHSLHDGTHRPPFANQRGGHDLHVQRITRPQYAHNLTHLIMVPGHAIWKGSRPELRMDDNEWVLEPYQRGKGRVTTLFSHIVRGAELAMSDPHSLLIFSGGQTRGSSSFTEADSYLRLALLSNVFQNQPPPATDHPAFPSDAIPFERATSEQYALDSYQNLLFSVARFQEFTGHPPIKITVVGYEMKRRRFVSLHRKALRWPEASFIYVGVGLDPKDNSEAWEGEKANALQPYEQDLYGCHSSLLEKRLSRNPFARVHPYGRVVLDRMPSTSSSAPDSHPADGPPGNAWWDGLSNEERAQAEAQSMLGKLIDWCPQPRADWTKVYEGLLPWDEYRTPNL